MTRRPSFVVIGQGKAGTSLIYSVLGENPAIGLSSRKELHFFNQHFDKGIDWYTRHFEEIGADKIIGEVSPSYLGAAALPRLAETLGRDTKIIFALRRPIERLYARYLQNICANPEPRGFRNMAGSLPAILERQLDALRLCYDLFGADNILPLFFETDIACPKPSYEAKILAHIGAPDQLYGHTLPDKRVNPTVMPRYLLSGDEGYAHWTRDLRFYIPKNRLIFCGQLRNAFDIIDPTPDDIAQAFQAQSLWTSEVTEADYAQLQEKAVLPAAEALEAEFGFDMGHWRNPPRRIAYSPGFPPLKFRRDAG